MADKATQRIREIIPDRVFDSFHEKVSLPITLATVLRATAAEPSKFKSWIDAEVFDEPHFLLIRRHKNPADGEDDILDWNLVKYNYDEQSKETKEFIGKLLGL